VGDAPYSVPPPSGSGMKNAILGGAIVALLAANVYLYLQLDRMKTDMAKFRESMLTEIANLRETSSVTNQTARRHLDSLKEELETTRRQASSMATQAKAEAMKKADQIQQQIEAEQKKVASQLTEVKESAGTANNRITEVSGDVTTVKSQLGSTQAELQKTVADLKKVTGDLGVQSGYIATNGKEIAALRRLGERNIFEFNLGKTKEPQRVGDITMLLKKADPKRNKYTIEVMADDKKTEKKDRTVNEPVQFYVSKARQPYEIVVNAVKKDQITGYLATPKDQVARNDKP
jgi:predicted  nucleic acid-binding Zn-ribbon protein